MGTFGLTAKHQNRKYLPLAVLALLLVIFLTVPLIVKAAPTEAPATPTPAPTVTEITIQKQDATQWWVVYPDGRKVTFESVADYRFAESDEATEDFFKIVIVDNNNNKLPVEFLEAKAYMQSKGYWENANKDEDEKGFWDKVTGFLDDIYNGVTEIATNIKYILKAVITGKLLSILISGLVGAAGSGLDDLVLSIINYADSTETLFKTTYARGLVSFALAFGFMLWIIGFIIATAEVAINQKSNRLMGDTLHDYIFNFFKSFLALTFFTTVPLPLYLFVTRLATNICQAILGMGAYNTGKVFLLSFNEINWDWTPSDLMLLIFFIALLFSGLKVLFSFVKRGGILMILFLVGSVHMITIPRGYWDAFWGWCRQVIALCITQFCQMALFCTGIAIIFSNLLTSFGIFMAGLSLTLAAAEVPRIAERYGMDTSLKGNAAGAIQTVSQAARLIISKH